MALEYEKILIPSACLAQDTYCDKYLLTTPSRLPQKNIFWVGGRIGEQAYKARAATAPEAIFEIARKAKARYADNSGAGLVVVPCPYRMAGEYSSQELAFRDYVAKELLPALGLVPRQICGVIGNSAGAGLAMGLIAAATERIPMVSIAGVNMARACARLACVPKIQEVFCLSHDDDPARPHTRSFLNQLFEWQIPYTFRSNPGDHSFQSYVDSGGVFDAFLWLFGRVGVGSNEI